MRDSTHVTYDKSGQLFRTQTIAPHLISKTPFQSICPLLQPHATKTDMTSLGQNKDMTESRTGTARVQQEALVQTLYSFTYTTNILATRRPRPREPDECTSTQVPQKENRKK